MTTGRIITWFALGLALHAPMMAQDTERVALRVNSSLGGGRASVDRGKRDLVETGDVVVLRPRGQQEYRGVVIEVSDRTSLVQLHDKTFRPAPGTRGEVLIPKHRQATKPDPKKPVHPIKDPTKPVFKNKDEDWRPSMPLLDQGRPVRPHERPTRITGRIYSMGMYADTARSTNTDSYFRAGTDLEVENPFGYGGAFSFDAEYDVRTERGDNNENQDILLREFSYRSGGTRFDSTRLEIGRFLQHGMPEFQVLDGIEWGARRADGHRFGASVGYMPEPDEDYESLEDLQIAVYYDWVVGEREEMTFSVAAQKSWHNGHNDRDLLISKIRYLPVDGWDFHSTLWIDYYDGTEVTQNAGFDVTQGFATLRRRYQNGDSVDLTYRRVKYPDIRRHEFIPPLQQHLANNRYDRLALTSRLSMSSDTRFVSQLGVWDDEEDSGGNADLGIESRRLFTKRDRLDVTLFGSLGQTTTSGGGRVTYGVHAANGSWDVFYEYGFHHYKGAASNRNNLVQSLFRASRSFYTANAWDLTVQAGAVHYDHELSWTLDFYLQKTF